MEKRRNPRFQKNYMVRFSVFDDTKEVNEVSQLFDISRGGLKFLSYRAYALGTKMTFRVRLPFMYPNETVVNGVVVALQEILKGKTFKIGVEFNSVTPEVEAVLEKMEQLNAKNS